MTPELWERLKPLFHAALDRDDGDRAAFISEACGNDLDLKDNLVRLLNAADKPSQSFDHPLVHLTFTHLPGFQAGEVILGRFRIDGPIGSGGMGEVYEAWDSELRETVALKTIRPEIAKNSSVIEHFKEEVKQARRIAHPNVCRVYDLFSHELPGGQVWFLTMQLLEGRTLQEQIRQEGPFSTDYALALIEQMVAGLAAAHQLGVIHRDFKSSNVMLVPSLDKKTHAVITDFGLATRISVSSGQSQMKGQGTPAYAAPEQWHEGIVGPAADQYSLGVVICEMITGRLPVREDLDSDRPRVLRMPGGAKLPSRWQKTVRRCLEVRPENRFGSVTEVLTALNPRHRQRSHVRLLTAAFSLPLVAAMVLLAVATAHRNPTIRDLTRVTPDDALSFDPSLSEDGSMVAYASDQQTQEAGPSHGNISDIWLQRLVQHHPDGPPTRITNDAAEDDVPSLSPDGRRVAFVSAREPQGIYIADTSGGGEQLLIPAGKEPRFSPDGKSILYWKGSDDNLRPAGSTYVFDLATQKSTHLAVGFADAHGPVWNSDGKHILFTGCRSSPDISCWDWWMTSIDEPKPNGPRPQNTGAIAILKGRDAGKIARTGSIGSWHGDTVLFTGVLRDSGEQHLWTLTVSPKDGRARGEPRELTPVDPREKDISSSLAGNNVLALTELSSVIHIWRIDDATRAEPSPKAYPITQDAEMDTSPTISANGTWLTFARGLSSDRHIWVINTQSGEKRQFATSGTYKGSPVIDDSATTLAYESQDGDLRSVYLVRQDSGEPAQICAGCQSPTGWVKGTEGLLLSDGAASKVNIYWLATGQLQTILAKPGTHVTQATWSPANQFMLFTVTPDQGKDEGNDQAKAQAFAARFEWGTKEPDSRWIALTEPSESVRAPRWSSDGRTFYYLSDRDDSCCLWAQHFDPRAGRTVGQPFSVQRFSGRKFSPYVISPSAFNLSVAGNSVYLNVADLRGSIWIGQLDHPLSLDFLRFQ